MDFIRSHLLSHDEVGLIFFTETWLSNRILDSMLSVDEYSILRSDRQYSKGGGVALLYKRSFSINLVHLRDSSSFSPYINNFEFICVDMLCKYSSVRFLCIYLPPKFSACVETVKTVCLVILQFTNVQFPCFVFGDFNLPNINWSTASSNGNKSHDLFLEFCIDNGWSQEIHTSTHLKQNILDLLFCNYTSKNILISSSVNSPLSSTCDHNLISFTIQIGSSTPMSKPKYPNFSKADYQSISNSLSQIDWNTLNYSLDPPTFYNHFISCLHAVIQEYVPISSPRKKTKLPKNVRVLLSEKQRIYRLSKTDKSYKSIYKEKSKQYENAVRDWIDCAESKICDNPSSKKFYSFVNNKLKTSCQIPPLIDESSSSTCLTDMEKATLFNSSFQTVFTADNGKLPTPPSLFFSPMYNFQITSTEILQAINKLKDKITRTPEEVPSYFIKRIAFTLLLPLTIIFTNNLFYTYVPSQWKESLIVPIYKKGNKTNPLNYRPISLTSSFSRIFESILHVKISQHLAKNSLLSSNQYGFLSNKSSCDQLLICIHEWLLSVSEGIPISVVYTDIAKAFDSVSHTKLIFILKHYGISECVCNWLCNFLTNRRQSVCVGSAVSSPLPVYSGVPQGSVIGPLLFLIYFNSLTKEVDSLYGVRGIKLFADDAKVYDTSSQSLQISLDKILSWLQDHQLNIAANKCFTLNIHNRTLQNLPSLTLDNTPLQNIETMKDLGIIISSNLKWHSHINSICNKAAFSSYHILKSFRTKNIWIFKKLFVTYTRPIVEYNTPVWSPYLSKDISRIESIQRLFTRRACLKCGIHFTSYQDRLEKLKLDSLEKRRQLNDLYLMYKIIHNLCSISFNSYFSFISCPYNLRRNSLQIHYKYCTKFKTLQWSNIFFNRIVKTWNDLPDSVVTAPNLNAFKYRLRKVKHHI